MRTAQEGIIKYLYYIYKKIKYIILYMSGRRCCCSKKPSAFLFSFKLEKAEIRKLKEVVDPGRRFTEEKTCFIGSLRVLKTCIN